MSAPQTKWAKPLAKQLVDAFREDTLVLLHGPAFTPVRCGGAVVKHVTDDYDPIRHISIEYIEAWLDSTSCPVVPTNTDRLQYDGKTWFIYKIVPALESVDKYAWHVFASLSGVVVPGGSDGTGPLRIRQVQAGVAYNDPGTWVGTGGHWRQVLTGEVLNQATNPANPPPPGLVLPVPVRTLVGGVVYGDPGTWTSYQLPDPLDPEPDPARKRHYTAWSGPNNPGPGPEIIVQTTNPGNAVPAGAGGGTPGGTPGGGTPGGTPGGGLPGTRITIGGLVFRDPHTDWVDKGDQFDPLSGETYRLWHNPTTGEDLRQPTDPTAPVPTVVVWGRVFYDRQTWARGTGANANTWTSPLGQVVHQPNDPAGPIVAGMPQPPVAGDVTVDGRLPRLLGGLAYTPPAGREPAIVDGTVYGWPADRAVPTVVVAPERGTYTGPGENGLAPLPDTAGLFGATRYQVYSDAATPRVPAVLMLQGNMASAPAPAPVVFAPNPHAACTTPTAIGGIAYCEVGTWTKIPGSTAAGGTTTPDQWRRTEDGRLVTQTTDPRDVTPTLLTFGPATITGPATTAAGASSAAFTVSTAGTYTGAVLYAWSCPTAGVTFSNPTGASTTVQLANTVPVGDITLTCTTTTAVVGVPGSPAVATKTMAVSAFVPVPSIGATSITGAAGPAANAPTTYVAHHAGTAAAVQYAWRIENGRPGDVLVAGTGTNANTATVTWTGGHTVNAQVVCVLSQVGASDSPQQVAIAVLPVDTIGTVTISNLPATLAPNTASGRLGVATTGASSDYTIAWSSTPAGAVFTPSATAGQPTVSFPLEVDYTVTATLTSPTAPDSPQVATGTVAVRGTIGAITIDTGTAGVTPTALFTGVASPELICHVSGTTTNKAYQWETVPAGGVFSAGTSSRTTVTFPTAGSYQVRCTVTSTRATDSPQVATTPAIAVTVERRLGALTVAGPATGTAGKDSTAYSVTWAGNAAVAGATYQWTTDDARAVVHTSTAATTTIGWSSQGTHHVSVAVTVPGATDSPGHGTLAVVVAAAPAPAGGGGGRVKIGGVVYGDPNADWVFTPGAYDPLSGSVTDGFWHSPTLGTAGDLKDPPQTAAHNPHTPAPAPPPPLYGPTTVAELPVFFANNPGDTVRFNDPHTDWRRGWFTPAGGTAAPGAAGAIQAWFSPTVGWAGHLNEDRQGAGINPHTPLPAQWPGRVQLVPGEKYAANGTIVGSPLTWTSSWVAVATLPGLKWFSDNFGTGYQVQLWTCSDGRVAMQNQDPHANPTHPGAQRPGWVRPVNAGGPVAGQWVEMLSGGLQRQTNAPDKGT